MQGCFRYSMNGKAPPLGDPVLVAVESYAYFLAKGAPTGVKLAGQGYPKLPRQSLRWTIHVAMTSTRLTAPSATATTARVSRHAVQ